MKSQKTYSVGEWVFHNAELAQVENLGPNGVKSVTYGYGSTSGNGLLIRPMTMRNKLISAEFESCKKKLHQLNCASLNLPDLLHHLNVLWTVACDTDDDAQLRVIYIELDDFYQGVADAVDALKNQFINGIEIFRFMG